MAKRQPTTTVTFPCTYGACAAPVTTELGNVLELLNICPACLAKRKERGLKQRAEAEEREAGNAR